MISIIVPVYNAQSVLNRCVACLLAQQGCGETQIILVNDGSTDDSPRLCDELAVYHRNITVIHRQNGGPSAARNTGLQAATGEFVMFVDCDDTIAHTTCAALLDAQTQTDSQLVVYGYNNVTGGKVSAVSFGSHLFTNRSQLAHQFASLYVQFFFNSVCNKLYLRRLITTAFPHDKNLGEDLQFNLAYLQNCYTIVVLPQCFYNYIHENADGLTLQYRDDKFDLALQVYDMVDDFCRGFFGPNFVNNGNDAILVGDVMRTIQRYVFCSPDGFWTKYRQIRHWMKHPRVMAAAKGMYTGTPVFMGLKAAFTLRCAFFVLLCFEVQKLVKKLR
ncbi:MAG: glycosyltransferase [Oscillospiraceae bacterium]|nr:glycosyltransferase [Oscillospiraceae bacterium]